MRTNIDLNDELVAEAMRVTGARTKREVVERALAELVARSKRPSIAGLLGLGGLDAGYDHKVARGAGQWHRVEEARATLDHGNGSAPRAAKKVIGAKNAAVRATSARKPVARKASAKSSRK